MTSIDDIKYIETVMKPYLETIREELRGLRSDIRRDREDVHAELKEIKRDTNQIMEEVGINTDFRKKLQSWGFILAGILGIAMTIISLLIQRLIGSVWR